MTISGLDKIPWTKLETVDGKATKAPGVLRDLASGDAAKARAGAQWLFTEVLHQSTPAPSAETFVPFLVELVGLAKQPARWDLLALLGDLACDGDHRPFVFTGYQGTSSLHAAVAAGHSTYVKALADTVANARAGAAFVLAWLPEHAKASTAALKKAVAKESDATAFASMLLALAVLVRDTQYVEAALEHDERFVRAAGVAALAMVGPLPAAATTRLEKLAAVGSIDYFSWWHGGAGVLLMQALIHAATRDGDVALLERMWFSEVGNVFAAPALRALFPAKIVAATLTGAQRSLLERVTSEPVKYGQTAALWEERGLPASAKDARTLLGFAAKEALLDAEIAVDGVTKPIVDHLTDAMREPAKRGPLARALAQGRTGEQLIELLFEAHAIDHGPGTTSAVEATDTEIMSAAAEDIVPLLLGDLTRELPREDGRLIVATLAPSRASALALASRGVVVPDAYLERVANVCAFSDERSVTLIGEGVVAFLRSIDVERRIPRLAQIYRNVAPWVQSGKLLLEQLMPESPHPELSAVLLARVKELKAAFAYGRKYGNSLFSEGFEPAALKGMKPKDHPLTAKLLAPIEAYATAAKAAGLAKDAKQLNDAIAKFLVA